MAAALPAGRFPSRPGSGAARRGSAAHGQPLDGRRDQLHRDSILPGSAHIARTKLVHDGEGAECAMVRILEAAVPLSAIGVAPGKGVRFQFSIWQGGCRWRRCPNPAGWNCAPPSRSRWGPIRRRGVSRPAGRSGRFQQLGGRDERWDDMTMPKVPPVSRFVLAIEYFREEDGRWLADIPALPESRRTDGPGSRPRRPFSRSPSTGKRSLACCFRLVSSMWAASGSAKLGPLWIGTSSGRTGHHDHASIGPSAAPGFCSPGASPYLQANHQNWRCHPNGRHSTPARRRLRWRVP